MLATAAPPERSLRRNVTRLLTSRNPLGIGAERRRRGARRGIAAAEAEPARTTATSRSTPGRAREAPDQPALDHLRMLQHLRHGQHLTGRNTVGVELRRPLGGRPLRQRLLELGLELVAIELAAPHDR